MSPSEKEIFEQAIKRRREFTSAKNRPEDVRANFLMRLLQRLRDSEEGKKAVALQKRTGIALFDDALADDARRRQNFRIEARKNQYPKISDTEVQELLQDALKAAEIQGSAKDIIKNPESLSQVISMELAARIATLSPEMQQDPRVLYSILGDAYHSIDWKKLTSEQAKLLEGEFKVCAEDVFGKMRQTKEVNGRKIEIPDNARLWRGLGDYVITTDIADDEVLPPKPGDSAPASEIKEYNRIKTTNEQHQALRKRLYEIQSVINRSDPTTKSLKEEYDNLLKDIAKSSVMESEAEQLRQRLAQEIKELEVKAPPRGKVQTGEAAVRFEEEARGAQSTPLDQEGLKTNPTRRSEQGPLWSIYSNPDPGDPNSVEAIFPGNTELQAGLLRIRNFLTPASLEEQMFPRTDKLLKAEKMLDQLLRDNRDLAQPQQEYIESYKNMLRSEAYARQQKERPASRFYLDPVTYDLFKRAPVVLVESKFITAAKEIAIAGPGSARAKTALEELDLIQYILFSNGFDEARVQQYALSPELVRELGREAFSEADFTGFREAMTRFAPAQKEKFGRSFVTKYSALQWLEAKTNADGPANKDYQAFVNRMNDEDFFGLDGGYGELLARIRPKLRTVYLSYGDTEEGYKAGHNPAYWNKAIAATAELIENDPEMKKLFSDYMNGEYFKINPFDEQEQSTLKAIGIDVEHVLPWKDATVMLTKFAAMREMMDHLKDNHDLRFLPPSWSVALGDMPSTFNKKEFWVAQLKQSFERQIQTWGSETAIDDNDRIMWRKRSVIVRNMAPSIDEWSDEVSSGLWDKIQQWKRGGMGDTEERRQLFAEVEMRCKLIPLRDDMVPKATDIESFSKWLGKLKESTLKEEVRMYNGARIIQLYRSFPYAAMAESGFRRSHEDKFMRDAYQELIGNVLGKEGFDKFMEGRSLAGKMVGAGRSWMFEMFTGEREKARGKLINTFAEVSRYAPHEVAKVLRDGNSKSFAVWADENIGGMKNYGKEFKNLTLIWEDLNALCDKELLAQVDYSKGVEGLTKQVAGSPQRGQLEIIRQYFHDQPAIYKNISNYNPEDAMNAYMTKMKGLTEYLLENSSNNVVLPTQNLFDKLFRRANISIHRHVTQFGAVEEIADPRYIPFIIDARFDDYPYEWLQYPDRLAAIAGKMGITISAEQRKNLLSVTERFFEFGDQMSAPFRRKERDLGAAGTVHSKTAITSKLTLDQKPKIEAQAEMYPMEVGYQGTQAAAFFVGVEAGAELLNLKTKLGYALFEKTPGASDASEYVSSSIKAESPDELRTRLEHYLNATVGKGSAIGSGAVEELHKTIKQLAGISYWERAIMGKPGNLRWAIAHRLGIDRVIGRRLDKLDDTAPLGVWLFKARWIPPIFIGLLIAYAFVEIKNTVSQDKRGG